MNDIKIFNMDCFDLLETLSDKSIDLVLIDPPYKISRKSGFKNGNMKKYNRISIDFGEWDKKFNSLEYIIKECYRVLKNSGTLICFYDLWKISELKKYMENAKFKQLRFIEWIKTNPVPINSKINYLSNAREIAVTGVKKNKPIFNSEYDNGIYNYPIYHNKDRFHPTQKSVDLFDDLILKHSNEGDVVLDCFLGSGTTALSCLNTNRKFIGCEINKEYFDKSIERLNKNI